MNNNTANNSGTQQIHPLLAALLQGQGGQVSQNANAILDGTGAGAQLAGRESFLNNANQHSQDTLSNLLHNNPGGYVTNAAPLQGSQNANVQTDNSMTLNALLGIIGKATDLQNNAVTTAGSVSNNANDNATQNRGLSLQYGENDPNGAGVNGSSMNGMDAVNQVKKTGGGDLLNGLSQPEQYKVAQEIIAKGGVGTYRKTTANPLSDADRQEISGTNTTLTQINRINKQLSSSKHLQSVLDNPVMNMLAKTAINTGNQRMLGALGLSPDDVQALGDLTAINAQGDRQLIGGRLTGYLSSKLSPAMPGLDKNSKQNLQTIQVLKKNILDSVQSYSKGKGYNHYADIPGLDIGTFNLQAPNGHIYKGVNQQDVGEAIKNGYKVVQ